MQFQEITIQARRAHRYSGDDFIPQMKREIEARLLRCGIILGSTRLVLHSADDWISGGQIVDIEFHPTYGFHAVWIGHRGEGEKLETYNCFITESSAAEISVIC